MLDLASRWLITQITESNAENSVWFSDENILPHLSSIAGRKYQPLLISNRWDVTHQALQQGFVAQFNDFDCTAIADCSLDSVFYRVSKEKPVVHHIVNQAFRILKPGGTLIICGQKNEGIKTYIDKAGALFNCEQSVKKDGANYYARLINNTGFKSEHLLDDSNYSQLRLISTPAPSPDLQIFTKPGLFGWNKIDQGSALLVEQLCLLIPTIPFVPERILDLGCGYGYLSLMTAKLPFTQRVLTDNNAAALLAARHNCAANLLNAEVVATDAGEGLESGFDLILCNPPFHQGFSVDGDLTDKFLQSTRRLLSKRGIALFVVNQFIPLERKAMGLFGNVELVAHQNGFKVISLKHK